MMINSPSANKLQQQLSDDEDEDDIYDEVEVVPPIIDNSEPNMIDSNNNKNIKDDVEQKRVNQEELKHDS